MAPNKKIFALKQIKLYGRDPEAAAGFVDEITLLQRLRGHSNIIQLMDAEVRAFVPSFEPNNRRVVDTAKSEWKWG